MKTNQEILNVIALVECKDINSEAIQFTTVEAIGGILIGIKGLTKEWYLSRHSTKSEVVRTMHKMCEYYIAKNVHDWFNGFSDSIGSFEITVMEDLVKRFNYKNWRLVVEDRETHWLWKLVFDAPDNTTGAIETQHCRKFPFQKKPTGLLNSLVFNVAILEDLYYALLQAELHEMNEQFKYKGIDIYNPHLDVDVIHETMSSKEIFDVRATS